MAVKKVLLIQSRSTPKRIEREKLRFSRAFQNIAHMNIANCLLDHHMDWDNPASILNGHDAVFFGGSSDLFLDGGRTPEDPQRANAWSALVRLKPIVSHILKNEVPMLAICMGHQFVAEAHGGNVKADDAQRKSGTFTIRHSAEGEADALFGLAPKDAAFQYAHRDSVTALPAGATLLAYGEKCRYSALRYSPKAYSVQFHPEMEPGDLEYVNLDAPYSDGRRLIDAFMTTIVR